jgi:hypothetical protein
MLAVICTFTGCEKEETTFEEISSLNESTSKADEVKKRMFWAFYDCSMTIFGEPCYVIPMGCLFPGGNCLSTVEIRGREAVDDLDDFLNHVHYGTHDDYFSGNDYKATFGIVDSFPALHELLKTRDLSFVVQRSDTLDRHLYVIGYDSSVDPSHRSDNDVLVAFEIDD